MKNERFAWSIVTLALIIIVWQWAIISVDTPGEGRLAAAWWLWSLICKIGAACMITRALYRTYAP